MFSYIFKKEKPVDTSLCDNVDTKVTSFPHNTGRLFIRIVFDEMDFNFSKSFCGSIENIDETQKVAVVSARTQFDRYIKQRKECGFFNIELSAGKYKMIPWHRMEYIEITEDKDWVLYGKYENAVTPKIV